MKYPTFCSNRPLTKKGAVDGVPLSKSNFMHYLVLPKKNNAMVPGPECVPIIGPM